MTCTVNGSCFTGQLSLQLYFSAVFLVQGRFTRNRVSLPIFLSYFHATCLGWLYIHHDYQPTKFGAFLGARVMNFFVHFYVVRYRLFTFGDICGRCVFSSLGLGMDFFDNGGSILFLLCVCDGGAHR